MLAIVIAVGAASAGIGMSDEGVINTNGIISERKQQASPEERAELDRVSQNRGAEQAVDGGLVPSENQTSKAPSAPAPTTPASSTASSTATSTDEAVADSEAAATSSETSTDETTPAEPDGGLVPAGE